VRYPATVSSTYDGRLSLSGTGARSLVSGEITVTRMNISAETDLGSVLASLGEPPETPATSPVLQNIQFNVHVGSVPDLRIETSLVRNLQASVDLRLSGTALNPSLLGRTSITQGEIEFRGSRYDINRGDLSFVNPFRIEPIVNFELETRIGGVDIALLLSGPARKMNLTYRSDPPLQMSDLINLIAVGRAPTTDPVLAAQQSVTQQSLIQTGANTVLSQAIAQPFSRRLQRFFGVSRLKVDPQIGGAEANPSARISTEQQITNDITFTYSYDLSSAQQQVVRVEYQPNRRWSIIVVRDENGLLGSDFLYKKRLP
jgi:translocation and assembly module TamB